MSFCALLIHFQNELLYAKLLGRVVLGKLVEDEILIAFLAAAR